MSRKAKRFLHVTPPVAYLESPKPKEELFIKDTEIDETLFLHTLIPFSFNGIKRSCKKTGYTTAKIQVKLNQQPLTQLLFNTKQQRELASRNYPVCRAKFYFGQSREDAYNSVLKYTRKSTRKRRTNNTDNSRTQSIFSLPPKKSSLMNLKISTITPSSLECMKSIRKLSELIAKIDV